MNQVEQLQLTTLSQERFADWSARFYRAWRKERGSVLVIKNPQAFVRQLHHFYQQEIEPEQAFLQWKQTRE